MAVPALDTDFCDFKERRHPGLLWETRVYPPGKLSALSTYLAEFQVPGGRDLGGDTGLGRRNMQPKPGTLGLWPSSYISETASDLPKAPYVKLSI